MIKDYIESGQKAEFAILLYAGLFILSNFAGVSFFSDVGWAPYIQSTGNTNAPSGATWIEGSSLHWADGTTEYYTDHSYSTRGNWHLDSGSGSTAVDSSGNGNDAFINGSATWVTGRYDNALSFSGGSGEGVDFGHIWDDHSTAVTISFWYKSDSAASSGDRIISQDCSEWFCMTDYGTDTDRFIIDNTDKQVSATEGQWHHVAIVFNPTDSTADAYLDGSRVVNNVALDSWNHANRPIVLAGNTEGYGDISGNEWEGDIDEVRMYDAVLNPTIIKELSLGEGGAVSGTPGSAWIENNQLQWIDQNGRKRVLYGMDTGLNPSGASAGNAWLENGGLRYIDSAGNERNTVPRDCTGVSGGSGTYTINPDGSGGVAPFEVYCEMSENGGGWIKIRMDNRRNQYWWTKKNSDIDDGDSRDPGGSTYSGWDWSPFSHISQNVNLQSYDWASYTGDTEYDLTWTHGTDWSYTYSRAQMDAIRNRVSQISSTTEAFSTSADDDGCRNGEAVLKLTEGGSGYLITHFTSSTGQFIRNFETVSEMNNYNDVSYLIPAVLEYENGGSCSGAADFVAFGYEKDYVLVK